MIIMILYKIHSIGGNKMDKLGHTGITILKQFLEDLHRQKNEFRRLIIENNMRMYVNNIDVTQNTMDKLEALITEYSKILESAQRPS